MSKKRRKRRVRSSRRTTPGRPLGRPRLVTPEGDPLVFTAARYEHAAQDEIRQILGQADDFELEPESDGDWSGAWFETRPDAPSLPVPLGRRVLAYLTLTGAALEIEATSRPRLEACCWRLEELLGDRIRRVTAPRRRKRRPAPQKPFIPPPEVIADLEDQMLRQWIDESIPALGGLTPREAVKTPDGRRAVLALIDDSVRMQEPARQTPGMFAPDYRKVKKMLGLE